MRVNPSEHSSRTSRGNSVCSSASTSISACAPSARSRTLCISLSSASAAVRMPRRTCAEQIGATVANVGDTEICAIDPHGGQSRAHPVLIGILFRGFENVPVGQMDGGRKAFCPDAPLGSYFSDDFSGGLRFHVEAVFRNRFNNHRSRDFAVGFAPHTVGKHEEVQWFNDLVAIFVVGTHATQVGHAATCDSHTNSPCRGETTRRPTPVPGNSAPTLTEPRRQRKALNPTDYSLFRHIARGTGACSLV